MRTLMRYQTSTIPSSQPHPLWLRCLLGLGMLFSCAYGEPALAQSGPGFSDKPKTTATTPNPQEEVTNQKIKVGAAHLHFPLDWSVGKVREETIQELPIYTISARARDERVRFYLLVIDPFGWDIRDWGLEDILGPALADLLLQANAPKESLQNFYTFDCKLGKDAGIGRINNIKIQHESAKHPSIKQQELLSGIACGVSNVDRWVVAFVIVNTDGLRPLSLERAMQEAQEIMDSIHF